MRGVARYLLAFAVIANASAESGELNSSLDADNSVLGMQFRTCENFQASTDSSLVESPKIFTNTKATPQFAEFASEAKQPSLPLRFCETQNLGGNQAKIAESTHIAPPHLKNAELAESNIQSAESSADSATHTQEVNSSIVDEFLGLCEASNDDRTLSPSRKRADALPKKSPQDEFASDSTK